ncbi:MAG: exodeoxyribonuclease VII small subunit [Roseburia porci]|nr:exodeoxyribonuclease VII small subunit [Roseburia porci]
MSEENKMTLEERFDCLEDILEKMEESGVTLDQSFELYKSGVEQVKACNAMLDKMEKAMLVLNEDGELEEF